MIAVAATLAPHLLHVFPSFAAAGPQVRTVKLMVALGDEFRHSVLALDGRSEACGLLPTGLKVRLLQPFPKAGTLRTVQALRKLLASERPELLLTYNWGSIDAVIANRLGGPRPNLHHEEGFHRDELVAFKRRRVWVRRLLLPGVSSVIVPSVRLQGIASDIWKLPAGAVHLIPNGIHLKPLAQADCGMALRDRLGIPRSAFVIGGVGHLRGEKNYPRLVQALAALRVSLVGLDAHLLLLGEGPERGAIEAVRDARGLGRFVHLVGHQDRTLDYYRAMDVFCISSDTEQMPVALLEAMACNLPVASTDVGDIRLVLPEEQGKYLAPPAGADAEVGLRDALARLATDPELRRRLGAVNRTRVGQRYSFEGMVAAYRKRYREALESSVS